MAAIITITPNIALDRTLVLPHYEPGAVLRPLSVLQVAGGKGLNVARSLRLLGAEVCATGIIGGHTGQLIADLAAAEGLDCQWLQTAAETRICSILIDQASTITTGIYERGEPVSAQDWKRFESLSAELAARATMACICGSLPSGIAPESMASMIRRLKQQNVQVWVDSSGPALAAALQVHPYAIKVNSDELGEALELPISDRISANRAARMLCSSGIELVAITLGKQGAVLVDRDISYWAQAPSVPLVSAAGSGDAFLAALMQAYAQNIPPADALCRAAAAGAANAQTVGAGRFDLATYEQLLQAIKIIPL